MGLCLVFYSCLAQAQLNNETLLYKQPVNTSFANQVRTGVHIFGFSKNNEYFNQIADGYTLFGYHIMPRVVYYPHANMRIEAGALLWKDFGSAGFQEVQPTFTVKVQKEKWAFLFGTLEGNLNHGYIEPLYDLERIMTNRLENGLQFKYNTHRLRFDSWIDWRKMIYVADPNREEVVGGISSAVTLLTKECARGDGDSLKIYLPLQFTAYHKGGQIDNSPLPLVTVVNAAAGFEVEREFPFRVLHSIYTRNYLVGFKDFSNTKLLDFEEGHGIYLNVGADTKYQNIMLSYWQGDGYVGEYGGKLFQSASTTYKNADAVQEDRRLLILRLMSDVELIENLHLTLRLEPVLDLDNPKLEFSNSLYLTFDTEFFVAKPRRTDRD